MLINENLKLSILQLGNLASNGVLSTVANVDGYSMFAVAQTSGTQAVPIVATLPTPSSSEGATVTKILNESTGYLSIYGKLIPPTKSAEFIFTNSIWRSAETIPSNSGAVELVEPVNATATITAWGSFVEIGNTALTADAIITLPVITASDIGKTITFKRVDNANFRVLIFADAGNTVENPSFMTLYKQGGAITLKVVSLTKSEMISNIATSIDHIAVLNQPANGTLTASATVDIANSLLFNQTTANVTTTIPSPTQTGFARQLSLRNNATSTATLNFNVSGKIINVAPNEEALIFWNLGSWGTYRNTDKIAKMSIPIANAHVGTEILRFGEFDFRYSTTLAGAGGTGGNLWIRSVTAKTANEVWWNGEEEFITTESGNGAASLLMTANTWTVVGTFGASIRENITYRINTLNNFYEVNLINHNDTNIHLIVTKAV